MHLESRGHGPAERFFNARAGAVSIVFAAAVIPLAMSVGLAIDYSFYVQAQAQLNLAADAGAIHAVRIAANHYLADGNATEAQTAGSNAGLQWFAAQAGALPTGRLNALSVAVQPSPNSVSTNFDSGNSTFTSVVNFSGSLPTFFGGLFRDPNWGIAGSSAAVIATNQYVEIAMLIDNSSSMLIGATTDDIKKIENLTICAPTVTATQANKALQGTYAWNFDPPSGPQPYGYQYSTAAPGSASNHTPQKVPTASAQVYGSCNAEFTGSSDQCLYPPLYPMINANGFCPTGTGVPDAGDTAAKPPILPRTDSLRIDPNTHRPSIANIPQAPCGFACHDAGNPTNDYWTLVQNAKAQDPTLQLRYDVIQTAAEQVASTLSSAEQKGTNQFSLGVYQFNSTLTQAYPAPGGTFMEASTDLADGPAAIRAITTPAVVDAPNTDFPDAITTLASKVTAGGNGSTPSAPRKNLILITDGLEDYSPTNRVMQPITYPLPDTLCQKMKDKNFNIYVLYTPYYPLPNAFYLGNDKKWVEPTDTSDVVTSLQACASDPTQFYQATDSADINTALQTILKSALAAPARISQ